jgi:hypothetical protein
MTIWLKRTLFALVASYIALSPALPQIFGWGAPFVRQWTMYSGVGEGLPKGVFTLHREDGREERLTPLQVRGLERYPDDFHYTFETRVLRGEDLAGWVEHLCSHEPGLARISFEGRIGASDGWIAYSSADLCSSQALLAGGE